MKTSKDVGLVVVGADLVGLVDANTHLVSQRSAPTAAATTLATLPCSNSALEFIRYPGVDFELFIQTPS